MLFLALLPFIVFIGLLLWRRTSLLVTALIALLVTIVVLIGNWRMPVDVMFMATGKGVLVALDILVTVFGAIFFLDVLKQGKIIEHLCLYLETFSKDYRVQVILLAWFLENFLEGTAGFGTPSTVVAPLLVGLGFAPITAVSVSLLGNSTSVLFGAAGTPIRIGMAGLPTAGVAQWAAGINMIGLIVPIFMLIAVTAGKPQRWRQVWEALPFAIVAGLAFVIPAWLSTWIGEEFPSILGAIVGLFFMILMMRRGWFQPRRIRTMTRTTIRPKTVHLGKVWLPYGLLVLLLVVGKFTLGSAGITLHFGLSHTIALFNPGWAFFIAAVPVLFLWRNRQRPVLASLRDSFTRSIEPFLVIAFMSTMAQLMIHSANNAQHLPSLLSVVAQQVTSPWLPMWAPFVGAFGNFLTGSATVSNIMFGSFIYQAGVFMKMNGTFILALELVGAAAGNMIALADILPAQAVVGLRHQEQEVLRRVIVPCVLYVGLAGLIGMFIA